MGARVDEVGVSGLCETREEVSQCTGSQSFAEVFPVEGFHHVR